MLDRLRRNELKQPKPQPLASEALVSEPMVAEPEIAAEPKKTSDKLVFMIALFPKAYRGRAKTILSHLDGHIELDLSNRVVYNGDTVGSHLYDLVKYFSAPKIAKIARPLDAPQFLKLMQANSVPDGVITRRVEPVKWIGVY